MLKGTFHENDKYRHIKRSITNKSNAKKRNVQYKTFYLREQIHSEFSETKQNSVSFICEEHEFDL